MKINFKENKKDKLELKQLKMFRKDLKNVISDFGRYYKIGDGLSYEMSYCTKLCCCTTRGLITTYNNIQKRIELLEKKKGK